jgi:hypothetical protein
MAGVAEMADILLLSNDPGMVDFRKTQPAGQLEKYSLVTGDIDAIHFVGKAAPNSTAAAICELLAVLRQDFNAPLGCCRERSEEGAVLRHGTRSDDPHALEDRYDWLVKYINLRREPVLTH